MLVWAVVHFFLLHLFLPIISLTIEGFGGEKKTIECWNKAEQQGWTAATLSIVPLVQESGWSFGLVVTAWQRTAALGFFAELGSFSFLKTSGSISFLWGLHRLLTAWPVSELVGKQQECLGRLLVADNRSSYHWLRFHTFFLPWVFNAREFPFEKWPFLSRLFFFKYI